MVHYCYYRRYNVTSHVISYETMISYILLIGTILIMITTTAAEQFNTNINSKNKITNAVYSYSNEQVDIDKDDGTYYYDPNEVPPGMMYHFSLPSFSISLDVTRRITSLKNDYDDDDAGASSFELIDFQDELTTTIQNHLKMFYREKFLTKGIGVPVSLEVDLKATNLIWKEISTIQPKDNNLETLPSVVKKQEEETATTTEIVQTRTSASFSSSSLSSSSATTTISPHIDNDNDNDVVFVMEYELRGNYSCDMYVELSPIKIASSTVVATKEGRYTPSPLLKPLHVTQSLMDLFFLDAFQQDNNQYNSNNYSDIALPFSSSSSSSSIISNMTVTVLNIMNDLYNDINNKEQNKNNSNDSNTGGSIDTGDNYSDAIGMSPTMIVAVAFSTTFWIIVLAMWIYLCILMKRNRNRTQRSITNDFNNDVETNSTTTIGCFSFDSPTSSYSGDSSEEEEDATRNQSLYLDAWANSITSIPLWNANSNDSYNNRDANSSNNNKNNRKRKKKKKCGRPIVTQSYFRPGHEHSSFLDCIVEVDDNESCCSTSHHNRRSLSSVMQQKTDQHRRLLHSRGNISGVGNNNNNNNNSASLVGPSPLAIPDEDGFISSQVPTTTTESTTCNSATSSMVKGSTNIKFDGHSTTGRNSSSSPLLLPNLYDTMIVIPSPSQGSQVPSDNIENTTMTTNELLLEDVSLSDIVSEASSSTSSLDHDDNNGDDVEDEDTTGYDDDLRYCYV